MIESIIVDRDGRAWLRWQAGRDTIKRSYVGHVSEADLRLLARDFCLAWKPFPQADDDGAIIVAKAEGRYAV